MPLASWAGGRSLCWYNVYLDTRMGLERGSMRTSLRLNKLRLRFRVWDGWDGWIMRSVQNSSDFDNTLAP